MNLTALQLLSLAVLVVATGLLGWIARLLYTWRERNPLPVSLPPASYREPESFPPPRAFHAPEAAPTAPGGPPPAPPAPPTAASTPTPPPQAPSPAGPVFYEYTDEGLVPVDPYHTAPPEAPPAAEPEEAPPSTGDSDGRVEVEALEEEGFVWL